MKKPLPDGVIFHSERPDAERVFKGVRFDVYQWQQKQFDGTERTFETVRRTDNVFVLAIIDGQVVAVREEQPHWGKPGLNIVTGMIEENEGVLEAARRELLEETGMVFENFYLVHMEQPNVSAEWISYTVVATGFTGEKVRQNLDAGEMSEVIMMPVEEYLKKVKEFGFTYRQRCAEDYLIQDRGNDFIELLKNPAQYALRAEREV